MLVLHRIWTNLFINIPTVRYICIDQLSHLMAWLWKQMCSYLMPAWENVEILWLKVYSMQVLLPHLRDFSHLSWKNYNFVPSPPRFMSHVLLPVDRCGRGWLQPFPNMNISCTPPHAYLSDWLSIIDYATHLNISTIRYAWQLIIWIFHKNPALQWMTTQDELSMIKESRSIDLVSLCCLNRELQALCLSLSESMADVSLPMVLSVKCCSVWSNN